MNKKPVGSIIFLILALLCSFSLMGTTIQVIKKIQPPYALVFPVAMTGLFAFLAWRGLTKYKNRHGKKQVRYQDKCLIPGLSQSVAEHVFIQPVINTTQNLRNLALKKRWDDPTLRKQAQHCIVHIIWKALEDGLLTEEEKHIIDDFCRAFHLGPNDFTPEAQMLLFKANFIQSLVNGEQPANLQMPPLPFNLTKSEIPLWLFCNVGMAELKTNTAFVSNSQGMTFKLTQRIYWRTGELKSRRVDEQELQRKMPATVLITSKHLYFQSGHELKRIRLEDILGLQPTHNGVAVYQETENAHALFFTPDDPWFFGNIIQNASNIT